MNNTTYGEDYIDRLTYILPIHRTLTPLERLLIVCIVSTFVSIVGCILLCLIYRQSYLRRKYFSKNKFVQSIPRTSLLVAPPPPSYDSVIKSNELLTKSPYLNIIRKPSNGTVSDSDGIGPNTNLNGKPIRSQSARSSLSNGGTLSTISNTYPLAPYAQLNLELDFDFSTNLLNIHLNNSAYFFSHSAFDDQTEYFIRIQLVDNKLLKKFQDAWKKHQVSLPILTWNKQQLKHTKSYNRTSDDRLDLDDNLHFQLTKSDLTSKTLRFLLFAIDRTGIEDLMFEKLIPLNVSMIPKYQQTIQFQNLPEIVLGEISIGISYLPTSERFTFSLNKLRYFCKTENKIDVRLLLTIFHNGRRFFQKKFPLTLPTSSIECEIKEILTQNIPQNQIQSVHIHLELRSSVITSSILLGEHTRYEIDWQKMIEYPRQTHIRYYQFFA